MQRKLCCLILVDNSALAISSEPIRRPKTDLVIGWVTSAGYGYSVGKSIAYGYLPIEYAIEGQPLDVEIFGDRIDAVVTPNPFGIRRGNESEANRFCDGR